MASAVAEQPQQQQVEQPQTDSAPQVDREALESAAQDFIDAREADAAIGAPRPRDEHGRFLPAKPGATEETPATETAEAPPVETQDAAPTEVNQLWIEAAKEAGVPEAEIAVLKSPAEFEQRLQAQRVIQARKAIDLLGIDPNEYLAFQQARQQGQQPQQPTQTQATPDLVQALDAIQDKITEDTFGADGVVAFKTIMDTVKATASTNAALQQRLDALEGQSRQRAEADAVQSAQQQWADNWDKAVSKIPGVKEFLGTAQELGRITTTPNHPRRADAFAFANYFDTALERLASLPISEEKRFAMAMSDAWEKSPFSRVPNGQNNNGKPLNGSVVRHSTRRSNPPESVADQSDMNEAQKLDVELRRAAENLGIAWDENGGNPFAAGQP